MIADGRTLVTTPRRTGSSANATIDVPITGAQILDLVVGDGGDGNGQDHGDWATPTLTCDVRRAPRRACPTSRSTGTPSPGFAPGRTHYENVGADPRVRR